MWPGFWSSKYLAVFFYGLLHASELNEYELRRFYTSGLSADYMLWWNLRRPRLNLTYYIYALSFSYFIYIIYIYISVGERIGINVFFIQIESA